MPRTTGIPSYFEYTVMSDYAYLELNLKSTSEAQKQIQRLKDLLNKLEGWHVVNYPEGHFESGYVGSVFKHALRRQMVIAHAGTLPSRLKTFLADARGVVGAQPDPLVLDALMQSQGQDQRSLQDLVTQEGYHVSFTGHSLGGFLAELSVYACHRGFGLFYPDASAVTFDSPGSLEVMEDWESHIPKEHIDLKQLNIISFLSSPNLVNTLHTHPGTVYRLVRSMSPLSFLSYLKESHSRKKMFALFNSETGFPEEGSCVEMADWPLADYEEWLSLKDHPVSGGADVLVTKTLDRVGHLGKGILGRLRGSQKKVKLSKLFGGSEATKLSALLRDASEKNYHIQFDTDTASGLSGAVNTHYIVKQLPPSIPSLHRRIPLINVTAVTVDFLRFHQAQQGKPLYQDYMRDSEVTFELPAYEVDMEKGYLYLTDEHRADETMVDLLDAVERLGCPSEMGSSSSSSSAPPMPSLDIKAWKAGYQAYLEATVQETREKAEQANLKLKRLQGEASGNKIQMTRLQREIKALEEKQVDLEQALEALQQASTTQESQEAFSAGIVGHTDKLTIDESSMHIGDEIKVLTDYEDNAGRLLTTLHALDGVKKDTGSTDSTVLVGSAGTTHIGKSTIHKGHKLEQIESEKSKAAFRQSLWTPEPVLIWSYDGIACEFIQSPEEQAYYQITLTLSALKRQQILERVQSILQENEEFSIASKTQKPSGHIRQICFSDKGEIDELHHQLVACFPSSSSSSSSSFCSKKT